MAVTVKKMALIVSIFGILSFILGVIAENKKPAYGIPVTGKDGVSGASTQLIQQLHWAIFLWLFLLHPLWLDVSLFYPYKGKSVPQGLFFKSTTFMIFFNIALFSAGLAAAMLLWPTITEQIHLARNVHLDLNYSCPTAKTGLLGGGAFLSLDSTLFWLVALMLADNAREDFFDEEKDDKGELGKVKVPSNACDADVEVNGSVKCVNY